MTDRRNKTYKGFKLKGPARAFGVKKLKGKKFAAFVVAPNGDIFTGEPRSTWEEAEEDIGQATFLAPPARIYAQPPAPHQDLSALWLPCVGGPAPPHGRS